MEAGEIRAWLGQDRMHCFSAQAFRLPGRHNSANLLAVVTAGLALELDPEPIQKTIDEYRGLPNRLEQVAEIDGVLFCNDSKATNVDAAVQSVSSFDRPLVLIAGGRHKGSDYTPLVKAAAGRVKKVILLGEARDLLARAFGGRLPVSLAGDMQQAVGLAVAAAAAGDVVLLAPACSSFDMFSGYVERGLAFKNAAEQFKRD
jgi:UDP-N-acetylmuramoylalanine--D-glutamate ligase